MYCAAGVRFADAANDEGLDVRCFDFDVYRRAVANCIERLLEGGNRYARDEWKSREIGRGKIGDSARWASRPTFHMKNGIVMYDNHPVVCGMNIELDSGCAELDCPQKGRNRILRQGSVSSSMGDSARGNMSGRQAFLWDGSFGW